MDGYGQLWSNRPNFRPKFYDLLLTMALIRTKWDSALKKIIKDEIGKGWNIERQSNKVKLVQGVKTANKMSNVNKA